MRNTTLTIIIAVLAALPAAALPTAGAADEDWRLKLSPALSAALAGDEEFTAYAVDGHYRVLITGYPLAVPDVRPDSRADWNAYWAGAAAPFLDAVRAHEDRVLGVWPAAPAMEVLLTADEVEQIARLDVVQVMDLDYTGAISLWGLDGPGAFGPGDSIYQTGVTTFWNAGFRGDDVLLAIIDTGIEASHPMLKDPLNSCQSRTVKWYDRAAGRTSPYDGHGHGTHVAGTAAGTTECGGQLMGMAPHARLMGVKILSDSGSGQWAWAYDGLQWAFDNGADITSNSWGGGDSSDSRGVAQLVNNLAIAGMESAFAAGNSGCGSCIGWPGQADYAVTVGATDLGKNVAYFSSRGPCSDGRICPDVMAVGVDVTSSFPGGGLKTWSGTSMATPHVGGAGALIIEATRTLVGRDLLAPGEGDVVKSELEDLLKEYAQDLGAAGPDNTYGWGYIQMTPIFDDILSRSRALVTMGATLTDAVLENDDVTDVTVTLQNLGGIGANGQFTATLAGPHETVWLADEALPVPGTTTVTRSFAFAAVDLRPGTYSIDFTYTYSWTDPITGQPQREILESALAFEVRRADLRVTKAMPALVAPGEPFDVTVTVTNVGNVPGTKAEFHETVPGGYTLVPRNPGTRIGTLWSDPAPNTRSTELDLATTLEYVVGDVSPGGSWTLTYTLVAYEMGEFEHASTLVYANNGVGRIEETFTTAQTVGF